ncbi:DUF262 domain-containing protein [Alloalcanivorax sp. C16-1]|uniref:DUF262 domain-containing protein n=1 Tax=Alloalcanivorax sp. C16-1 TaxID=3390051 RepID=UPI0039709A58
MSSASYSKFQVKNFDPRTLTWWKSKRLQIDMDPPYQRRGRLWSTADKAYLIDSILNGFDVPKIYLADFTWSDSKLNKRRLPYAIIDGKQRFEAIFDFFDGDLVLNADFVLRSDPALKLGGLGYRDLQRQFSAVAEEFDNFHLHVMSVFAETEEPINDLFVRLNRSKALTGAEIRNAMGGPVPEMLREIASRDFFIENVRFSVTRGQDLNTAAKFLLFESLEELQETKKSTLDKFVQRAKAAPSAERSNLELAARRVVDVLRDMESVFLPKDQLLASAGIVPVYYWLVRSLSPKQQNRLRAFLVKFEDLRRKNRELLKEKPDSDKIDGQLVEYDNYNRSTNDQLSHVGRFRILKERFGD